MESYILSVCYEVIDTLLVRVACGVHTSFHLGFLSVLFLECIVAAYLFLV